MLKVKYTKGNIEKTNVVFDEQGRIGIKDIEPTAQLDVNGTLRVRNLENQELLKDKKLQDLRAMISDKEGNVFSLHYDYRDSAKDFYSPEEDHFVMPILRSGGRYMDKDQGLELEIKNLFGPLTYRKGRHLIEVKLLVQAGWAFPPDGVGCSYSIHYMEGKLYEIPALRLTSTHTCEITQPDKDNKKLLTLEDKRISLEVIKNKTDQEDEDILIKYSPDAHPEDENKWCKIKYFITSYFSI